MNSRLIPIIIAICFLVEPIYFIFRGLIDPSIPRMADQPAIYSIILVISAFFPAYFVFFSKKIQRAPLRSLLLIIGIYAIFILWSIFYGLNNKGVLDDFFISGVMVIKGISIRAFFLKNNQVDNALKNLSLISILISIFYIAVLFQQATEGILFPGIGGATYQKASYMLVQLIILNFMATYFFNLESNASPKFLIFFINVILFLGVLYNGGRGAALLILLSILLLTNAAIRKVIRNAFALRLEKFHFLVFLGAGVSFSAIGYFITPEIIALLTRGSGRIFEAVTIFSSSNIDGDVVSGRDVVYQTALNAIVSQPCFGYGPLWSARLIVPAHNIFLDLLLQFGVLLGTIFIVGVVFLFINVLAQKKHSIFYSILAPAFTFLLFSGNYLLSFEFWIFITIAFSTINYKNNNA